MKRTDLAEIGLSLVETALGKQKADLVVKDGTLINVYSGELLEGVSLAIKQDRIAYVGVDADHMVSSETKVINASGRFIAPGFIDAHTHIDIYCTPTELSKVALPHGTTTVFAEPDELTSVLGFEGMKLFTEEVRRLPLRVYILIPLVCPQDPAFETTHTLKSSDVQELLRWGDVAGLGEAVAWTRVLSGDDDYFSKFRHALTIGKRIEGHTAGAKGVKLIAYTAAGISSCHESITPQQVVERLRLGICVMVREGSLRRDLAQILPTVIRAKLDLRNMALVTDSLEPEDLIKYGYMDFIARRAIELGLDPIKAIQMVTINPAIHFRLDNEIGGIAPGRFADIALINNLEKVDIWLTISGGRIIAKEGKMLDTLVSFSYPELALKTIHVLRKLKPDDFSIKAPPSREAVKVRVAQLVNESITKLVVEELPVIKGKINSTPERDIMKMSVIDRHWSTGRVGLGLVKGFKAHVGAVSSSLNFDENNIVVIGSNDQDMAIAVNKVIDLNGGIIIANHGEVIYHLAMPIAGVMSQEPITIVSEKMERMNVFLRKAGCPFQKPLNVLLFLTFVTLPEIRLTDKGLVDVKSHQFISLFLQ